MTTYSRTAPARLPLRRVASAALTSVLLAALVLAVADNGSWAAALLGAVGPDIALLLGGGAGLARGQLHPRAVPFYNAAHRFWGPIALVAAASAGLVGPAFLVGGLAWALHVALDRTVGYGLRDRDGFQRAG
jgi:hypothetical protein